MADAGTAVDRTTVIMSIRPQYADAIMDGTKLWEFHRKPLPDQVRNVLVYRSGALAGRGIVGSFTVAGQSKDTVDWWRPYVDNRGYSSSDADPSMGISIQDLGNYVEWGMVHAITVGSPVRFPAPIPLAAFVSTSPQSWVYAPYSWRSVVRFSRPVVRTLTEEDR